MSVTDKRSCLSVKVSDNDLCCAGRWPLYATGTAGTMEISSECSALYLYLPRHDYLGQGCTASSEYRPQCQKKKKSNLLPVTHEGVM
jgi:hypothetical protein